MSVLQWTGSVVTGFDHSKERNDVLKVRQLPIEYKRICTSTESCLLSYTRSLRSSQHNLKPRQETSNPLESVQWVGGPGVKGVNIVTNHPSELQFKVRVPRVGQVQSRNEKGKGIEGSHHSRATNMCSVVSISFRPISPFNVGEVRKWGSEFNLLSSPLTSVGLESPHLKQTPVEGTRHVLTSTRHS